MYVHRYIHICIYMCIYIKIHLLFVCNTYMRICMCTSYVCMGGWMGVWMCVPDIYVYIYIYTYTMFKHMSTYMCTHVRIWTNTTESIMRLRYFLHLQASRNLPHRCSDLPDLLHPIHLPQSGPPCIFQTCEVSSQQSTLCGFSSAAGRLEVKPNSKALLG